MVGKGLKGRAEKWWAQYKGLSLPWDQFKERLTNRFAGRLAKMQLQSALFSLKQGDKEAVGSFLQRKYLLAKRLRPEMAEGQLTSLLLELIKPTLKMLVRASLPTTFAELFEHAVQAEQDEADCAPKKEAPKSEASKPSDLAGNADINAEPKPPRYPRHYCQGFHFHRD
ncbi:activity-regulated cytoskeleton-associated protein-like [Belonocnema kinseyi]|uniref:activity-regulated cytoskeleton-associated protein-like n=1 Tax=Belonocnema kinseyi TaxID=2817044 RepID=UPI00143DA159|nr:activity-regulated cytoskeleton-associated protein-like [Belonocnema kinseyi]